MVCSAVVRMFDCGAFTTITPWVVAASVSTLSSPMPARPDHHEVLAGGQHLGGDGRGRADDQRVGARRPPRRAAPGVRSSCRSTSWPAARSRSRPPSAIFSVTRIRAMGAESGRPPPRPANR